MKKALFAVINERGQIVGVFRRADFAEALIMGLHTEQMAKVGCILDEYSSVPVEPENIDKHWKE